jgi:radical SAM superfamily enzyme YgiQ (UPF0313 family)
MRVLPGVDYEEILKLMKEAGFHHLTIGIQSGSKRVRNEILRRKESNSDIINAIGIAKKLSIKIRTHNMIGVPTETAADFNKTVAINRLCRPDASRLFIFYPYPGTDLCNICAERGLIKHIKDNVNERREPALTLPELPTGLIKRYYRNFHKYIRISNEDTIWAKHR